MLTVDDCDGLQLMLLIAAVGLIIEVSAAETATAVADTYGGSLHWLLPFI